MLIDSFVPVPDAAEEHSIQIAATREVVYQALWTTDFGGSLIVKAILWHDYPLIQGAVLLTSGAYVLVNLVIDVLYAWVDPRIRYA